MKYQVYSFGLSDIGLMRENNEDAFALLPDKSFFVLADGMGGHKAGEVAAGTAVSFMMSIVKEIPSFESLDFQEAHGMIQLAIERTNLAVYEKSLTDSEWRGMGTTLCCLLFRPQGVIYGHVGDSRIYRLRKSKLEQLTHDHSLMRELLDRGHLTRREFEECGFKNVITKAIGTEQTIDPSVHMVDVESHDVFLMCTDGLTDMLAHEEIETIAARASSPEKMVHALIDAAKVKGGFDNITVVAAQVKQK